MSVEQITALLITERDRLNRAIEALGAPTKRRGRPPKSARPVAAVASGTPRRKRKGMTAAQKKAHSERMRVYWAMRRKTANN